MIDERTLNRIAVALEGIEKHMRHAPKLQFFYEGMGKLSNDINKYEVKKPLCLIRYATEKTYCGKVAAESGNGYACDFRWATCKGCLDARQRELETVFHLYNVENNTAYCGKRPESHKNESYAKNAKHATCKLCLNSFREALSRLSSDAYERIAELAELERKL